METPRTGSGGGEPEIHSQPDALDGKAVLIQCTRLVHAAKQLLMRGLAGESLEIFDATTAIALLLPAGSVPGDRAAILLAGVAKIKREVQKSADQARKNAKRSMN